MKNFQELIGKRRSIRQFTDELLTPEQVETILKAALKSPSSKNKMPWEFVVVEDKDMLQRLAGCKKFGSKPVAGSPINTTFISYFFLAVNTIISPTTTNANGTRYFEYTFIQPRKKSAFRKMPTAKNIHPIAFLGCVHKNTMPAIRKNAPILIKFLPYGICARIPILSSKYNSPKIRIVTP